MDIQDPRKFLTHLEILKHSHPELVVDLAPDPADCRPVTLADGSDGPQLRWTGKSLHSPIAPDKEAEHVVESVRLEPGRAYLVFGVGLGHLIRGALGRLAAPGGLIVIEPDVRILRAVLAAIDFRDLLYDSRIHWVSGRNWRDHLRVMLRRCEESGLRPSSSILTLPAYRTYFSRALAESRQILAQFLNEREIDSETRKRLWDLWNQNLTENLPMILSSTPIRRAAKCFKGIPAVLVGAGPSLDDHLQNLARLKDRALLISVDTALAPLLSAGCSPDVVVAMDAQEENAQDFLDLPDHRTTLLFDAFCHPGIPRRYAGEPRIASSTGHVVSDITDLVILKNGLLPFLDHILDTDFGFLQNGGSVITGGFDFVRLTSCSAAGLIGADFAYPDFTTHSKLTQKFRLRVKNASRFETLAGGVYEELLNKVKLKVARYGGGQLWSDRVMLMYKHWMEDAAAKTGLPAFVIGVPRGASIAGYPVISVEEFIGRFGVTRDEIDRRIRRLQSERLSLSEPGIRRRIGEVRRDLARLDTDPSIDRIGPFTLEQYVEQASYEVGERLKHVLSVDPESDHPVRRQQAARASRKFVEPFLNQLDQSIRDWTAGRNSQSGQSR